METLQSAARRMLFWGALATMLWSGYELIIRVEASIKPLSMFFRLCFGEKIPFSRAILYIDWSILIMPGFLLLCFIYGLLAFSLRKCKQAFWFLLPSALWLILCNVGLENLSSPSLMMVLTSLPLFLVLVGCMLQVIQQMLFHGVKKENANKAPLPPPRSEEGYDPFDLYTNKKTNKQAK